MSAVSSITEGLLNFEQSIEASMMASQLLGRQINLDRARQLAFLDDQEGMMQEVLRAVGGEVEFNKLLSTQRRALAAAVGTDVETLSRLVRQRETGGQMQATTEAMSAFEKAQQESSKESVDLLFKIEKNTKGFVSGLLE